MSEFRLNGKTYKITRSESGKTYFDGIPQSEFFARLSIEDKRTLDKAEVRFKWPANNKSRQQILDDIWNERLVTNGDKL